MSSLIYNGATHLLTLTDSKGAKLGTWQAHNITDSHLSTVDYLHNGTYSFLDTRSAHPHPGDNINGPYGSYGIFRFNYPKHQGVGVHSGRANAARYPGVIHPTLGCVRTSDDAMAIIVKTAKTDPLTTITVQSNSRETAQSGAAWLKTHPQ
ncbi:hypothetical protein AA23498_0722 [Acetobacter nitrogenifigens DSM 23921 = NBRC 105050]|uniref:YkuD domain-containing protein n=1 Tax=Acetobacter nitrogenifigens DSM 23921 = NBRC 105050 TaxID=1120919 RepID=A0A511X8K0_9PROT|nr:hypothetical protein [Acetobacter nitrogenifigens]GBQ89826.1 hypothetical protein AA23498_0722 [Acetobacter nitrogenifigens DSM 23921 = NBRC 105050]GEN59248.1 hypothetical protein ANI02nite_11320 [Acetobacter nitrogenifigens DSM 23921 = NBRC 105050]